MREKNLQELAKFLHCSCSEKAAIQHFAIDSRFVEKGSVFFALHGEKADGHQFLKEVAEKKGKAAIVEKGYKGPDFGLILFRVENVKKALQELAKSVFSLRQEKVIAITGSMGKTTTKEFLATLLAQKFHVCKSPGNYNTQLTLPLTLLNLEETYDVLVLEMGMSQCGHIENLVQIAPPDIAVLTRIAPAGIALAGIALAGMEGFCGGLDAIAKAKSEIFSHPKTQLGILSFQASRFPQVLYKGGMMKWIYGWKEDHIDAREMDFVMEKKEGQVIINESPPISLEFEGGHLAENFLAATAAARAMGVSWKDIQEGAKKCVPYEFRFQKIEKEGIVFIQDCYNANPDSVVAALKNLPRPKQSGKVIGILGSMPDLGKASPMYHRKIGDVATTYLDMVFSVGEDAKEISASFLKKGKKAEHFSDLQAMKKQVFAKIKEGDVVLIKGANYLKLWEILEN